MLGFRRVMCEGKQMPIIVLGPYFRCNILLVHACRYIYIYKYIYIYIYIVSTSRSRVNHG